jgi:hypothetical protein
VDLGAVQGIGKHVEVELVSAQQDIDIAYQDALDNIRVKRAKVDEDERPSNREQKEQRQKDIYVSTAYGQLFDFAEYLPQANFRTNVRCLMKQFR